MADIKEIQRTELDILKHFDEFCAEHQLKYSLAYGTLIGAIRHHGFIPWDDDIDVMMPRKDYEYLLAHWNVPGYLLQNKMTDRDFSQNFTKIRKDHTAFIQFPGEKEVKYHKGIFIDIFPGDRVAPGAFQRKLQFLSCALNLFYSREGMIFRKASLPEKILLSLTPPHFAL